HQIYVNYTMNLIQLSSLAASKVARGARAARGKSVVYFGARRMHGAYSGVKEPRSFYIGGVDSTSSVLAGRIYGIPLSGTMAHSYIQACDDETAASRRFLRSYPAAALLPDTSAS